MNLLGVTQEGDYEVISWGKVYTIPKERVHGKLFFVSVTFENKS